MANTITFEMTETQARSFEKLLDEFNDTMNRATKNESAREAERAKLRTETHLLLAQAGEELKRSKVIISN